MKMLCFHFVVVIHNKTPFMFFPVGSALADPDIVFIMPPPAPTSKGPRTRDLFGELDIQINSVKNVSNSTPDPFLIQTS